MSFTRRQLVRSLLGAGALGPWATLSVAQPAVATRGDMPHVVFLILRGGMDGLSAVPATGDPAFAEARGALGQFAAPPLPLVASGASGGSGASGTAMSLFALHPLLPQLHAMYGRGELAVVHATGLPYRERSHFDAQQVLESGGTRPYELSTGWLGRALGALAGSGARAHAKAVALETAVPLVLRGPVEIDTWAPSVLPEPAPDLVSRLERLYAADPALSQALARARELRETPGMAANVAGMAGGGGGRGAVVALATKAAEFLQHGSAVAVLEMGGWDSHTNQAAPNGATSNNLRALDAALAALREGLQPGGRWARTVVLVATEFGREVAINGNLGTDHGSGGAAFVLGGAVKGGRVLADWPGLAKKDRFEGRDLRITTDLRAVLRTVLAEHLRVPRAALDTQVLPGSAALPVLDLLRG